MWKTRKIPCVEISFKQIVKFYIVLPKFEKNTQIGPNSGKCNIVGQLLLNVSKFDKFGKHLKIMTKNNVYVLQFVNVERCKSTHVL